MSGYSLEFDDKEITAEEENAIEDKKRDRDKNEHFGTVVTADSRDDADGGAGANHESIEKEKKGTTFLEPELKPLHIGGTEVSVIFPNEKFPSIGETELIQEEH